jgi:hypothetical protein
MARTNKAPKAPANKAVKSQSSTTVKPKQRKANSAAQKARPSRGSEVERRWAAYLKERIMLEDAVKAVRLAEQTLTKVREQERQLRKSFEESKTTLEPLLDVENATTPKSPTVRILESVPMTKPSMPTAPDDRSSLG